MGRVTYAGGGAVVGANVFGGLEFAVNPTAKNVCDLAGTGLEVGGGAGAGIFALGGSVTTPLPIPAYGEDANTEISLNVGVGLGGGGFGNVIQTYVQPIPLPFLRGGPAK